jgi:hypothetical protein
MAWSCAIVLMSAPTETFRGFASLSLCVMPPESAATFALCCRPLYFALEIQYVEDLRYGMPRENLLKLLEKDLPNHIICGFCKTLHAIHKASRYFHSNDDYWSLRCLGADVEEQPTHYIHPHFSLSIFEMTMKRHRQGVEDSYLLELLSLYPRYTFSGGELAQQTAAARLINDSLSGSRKYS